uniref:Uncharacterized protein n=1 Tax=Knipowitschia caucasica TaxID=637954 RepID=A0AAV2L1X0_KNICA
MANTTDTHSSNERHRSTPTRHVAINVNAIMEPSAGPPRVSDNRHPCPGPVPSTHQVPYQPPATRLGTTATNPLLLTELCTKHKANHHPKAQYNTITKPGPSQGSGVYPITLCLRTRQVSSSRLVPHGIPRMGCLWPTTPPPEASDCPEVVQYEATWGPT